MGRSPWQKWWKQIWVNRELSESWRLTLLRTQGTKSLDSNCSCTYFMNKHLSNNVHMLQLIKQYAVFWKLLHRDDLVICRFSRVPISKETRQNLPRVLKSTKCCSLFLYLSCEGWSVTRRKVCTSLLVTDVSQTDRGLTFSPPHLSAPSTHMAAKKSLISSLRFIFISPNTLYAVWYHENWTHTLTPTYSSGQLKQKIYRNTETEMRP